MKYIQDDLSGFESPVKYYIGLDMATHTSGIAILDSNKKLIDSKCIYGYGSTAKERIQSIYRQLDDYLTEHKEVSVGIIEDILLNTYVPNLNACRDLCVLQGSVLSVLWKHNIGWDVYTANHWKSVVGILSGPEGKTRSAQKERMVRLVKDKYNIDVDDNQADAIGIALAYIENNSHEV